MESRQILRAHFNVKPVVVVVVCFPFAAAAVCLLLLSYSERGCDEAANCKQVQLPACQLQRRPQHDTLVGHVRDARSVRSSLKLIYFLLLQ